MISTAIKNVTGIDAATCEGTITKDLLFGVFEIKLDSGGKVTAGGNNTYRIRDHVALVKRPSGYLIISRTPEKGEAKDVDI